MKITIYELLGMVKDGKAPKKIKYDGVEWEYTGYQYERIDKANLGNIWNNYNFNILNAEVEILEEEKKIPEKLPNIKFENGKLYLPVGNKHNYIIREVDKVFLDKINEIIDFLK